MTNIFSNPFDITIIALIVLLSLKGLINGALKEIMGFLGLIGGLFAGSRLAPSFAKFIKSNANLQIDESTLKIISFFIILGAIWLFFVGLGRILSALTAHMETSILSRLLGFVISGAKYFFVLSLIVVAIYNTPKIHMKLQKYLEKSHLAPTMREMGNALIATPELTRNQ
ncbi:MAG: CvpA family protein [Epsilonproteobacteria bacterium]|nr:CvpA family protein [Campylobacterota bacterium]